VIHNGNVQYTQCGALKPTPQARLLLPGRTLGRSVSPGWRPAPVRIDVAEQLGHVPCSPAGRTASGRELLSCLVH